MKQKIKQLGHLRVWGSNPADAAQDMLPHVSGM
jgi:hypothetical protein